MSGVNIVGVQFRRAGKIYDFDAKDLLLNIGDKVVVETERGPSLAEVKRINFIRPEDRDMASLKPIVRIASRKDLDTSGRLTEERATSFAKEKIKSLELDMHVINVEIQFGGNKVIIFFSAPGRVDFRELVKELAGGLKTRVELKQVGARDEAKLAGGIGICGREFCCSSFLREFVPVSIKMAKNQNLALNPSKVSGGCGRLLCCLTYEDEIYTELRQRLLPKGTRVKLLDGIFGDVIKGDILNQVIVVETDEGDQRTVPVNDLEVVDAREGVDDDWGDDIDFGSLMGDEEDISVLDDSEQIRKRRENQPKGIVDEIEYSDSTTAADDGSFYKKSDSKERSGHKSSRHGDGKRVSHSQSSRPKHRSENSEQRPQNQNDTPRFKPRYKGKKNRSGESRNSNQNSPQDQRSDRKDVKNPRSKD